MGSGFDFDAGEHSLLQSLLSRCCFVRHKETGYIDFRFVEEHNCDRLDCFRGSGDGRDDGSGDEMAKQPDWDTVGIRAPNEGESIDAC